MANSKEIPYRNVDEGTVSEVKNNALSHILEKLREDMPELFINTDEISHDNSILLPEQDDPLSKE